MSKTIPRQIVNFLSLFAQDVVEQITPEHREDAQYPQFLHISRNSKLGVMIPRISDRQMKNEDRTIPRVVGSPTLLGCMIGYYSLISDYDDRLKSEKKNKDWNGGYYIYSVDYEWRFTPSKKLVPDFDQSDEQWLLNYNQDNKEYQPEKIGKFFAVSGMRDFTQSVNGSNYVSSITFYVQIDVDEGVQFSPNIKLEKGYHSVTIPYGVNLNSTSITWKKDSAITVTKIEPGTFFATKKLTANFLGFQDNPYQW